MSGRLLCERRSTGFGRGQQAAHLDLRLGFLQHPFPRLARSASHSAVSSPPLPRDARSFSISSRWLMAIGGASSSAGPAAASSTERCARVPSWREAEAVGAMPVHMLVLGRLGNTLEHRKVGNPARRSEANVREPAANRDLGQQVVALDSLCPFGGERLVRRVADGLGPYARADRPARARPGPAPRPEADCLRLASSDPPSRTKTPVSARSWDGCFQRTPEVPPSRLMLVPVTKLAASDARKAMTLATSSALPDPAERHVPAQRLVEFLHRRCRGWRPSSRAGPRGPVRCRRC